MKDFKMDNFDRVFTTGAFLRPTKVLNADGKVEWLWTVSEFIDDSFKNGDVYNPSETAETLQKLTSTE